jgi:hypothetical protein
MEEVCDTASKCPSCFGIVKVSKLECNIEERSNKRVGLGRKVRQWVAKGSTARICCLWREKGREFGMCEIRSGLVLSFVLMYSAVMPRLLHLRRAVRIETRSWPLYAPHSVVTLFVHALAVLLSVIMRRMGTATLLLISLFSMSCIMAAYWSMRTINSRWLMWT